jgi:leucyl-tRNA synthetase
MQDEKYDPLSIEKKWQKNGNREKNFNLKKLDKPSPS